LNIQELHQGKTPDKVGGKDNTTSTKNITKDTTNKTIYNFEEELSLNKGHPPQSCEPPKNTATTPKLLLKDSFEGDLVSLTDTEFGEREFFMRCVMIGAKNTGKHELINTIFSEDKSRVPHERTGVNFVHKSKINFKTTRKYHFWINTLGENDSDTRDAIWKTYYKYATAFVFIYDTTNKQSLEALERAVKSVLEVVPQDQFFGILVGTKGDLKDQREIDCEDVNNFKIKYNFKYCVETNNESEKESSQILPRLNTKLKCIFEAI